MLGKGRVEGSLLAGRMENCSPSTGHKGTSAVGSCVLMLWAGVGGGDN